MPILYYAVFGCDKANLHLCSSLSFGFILFYSIILFFSLSSVYNFFLKKNADHMPTNYTCGLLLLFLQVLIQLIGQCSCACFDDIGGLYSHTGRVGGNPRPHIPGLNT